DLLVQGIIEMLSLKEARDAVVRLVVDEDGAEQSLLGLDVVRRDPKREGLGGGLACALSGPAACGFDHDREVGGFAGTRQRDSPESARGRRRFPSSPQSGSHGRGAGLWPRTRRGRLPPPDHGRSISRAGPANYSPAMRGGSALSCSMMPR